MSDQLGGALQENTLTLLCVSDEHCKFVRSCVPVNLFSTFLYRDIVSRVYDYIDTYGEAPNAHLPDLVEDLLAEDSDRSKLVDGLLHNVSELGENLNTKYVLEKLEIFIRQQTLKLGVIEAGKAIQEGRLDEAEQLMEKAMRERASMFQKGLTLEEAYATLMLKRDDRDALLLGIPAFDRRNFGPTRGELHLFMAATGRGKTWWLIHCVKRALLQRWKVLVVTLEFSPEKYGGRIVQSLFSLTKHEEEELALPTLEVSDTGSLLDIVATRTKRPNLDNPKTVERIRKRVGTFRARNNLLIKQFPPGQLTIQQLRGYLDMLEAQNNFIPDLLVIDYPDLMKQDTANFRMSVGRTIVDLRGIATERNWALAVASQSNRDGADAKELKEKHVGEDYSKIHTSDIAFAYSQTPVEKELGVARLQAIKGRDDKDGQKVLITQSYATGQFVLDSRMVGNEYWGLLEKKKGVRSTQDDDDSQAQSAD